MQPDLAIAAVVLASRRSSHASFDDATNGSRAPRRGHRRARWKDRP